MSFLEVYVSARIKYDSITGRLSQFFWGREFSAYRLIIHLVFIVVGVGALGYDAASSGNYQNFYVFSMLGIFDLVGMYWLWHKNQNT